MADIGVSAVLFDMDGVIIDTHESVVALWEQWAARYNITLTEEDYVHHIFGTQAVYVLERYFPSLTAAERNALLQEAEQYESALAYQPVPGVLDFIAVLKHDSIPVGLVTSGEQHKVRAVTQQLGLEGVFDAIVTAELVQHGKPNPACYRLGAQKLNYAPADCLVFEDSRSGTQAAVAAGAICIGVGPARALLPAMGAAATIADFHDVAVSTGIDSLQLQIEDKTIVIRR